MYPDDDVIVTSHDTITNFTKDADILSVQSGDWSSGSTWDLGRAPQAGEIVGIKTTHTVTYGEDETTQYLGIGVAGVLAFRTDVDTTLVVQNLLIYGPEVLGAGNYGVLRIGTPAEPVEAGVTAEIIIPDVPLLDPNTGGTTNAEYSNGIIWWGERTIHGTIKTPYVRTTGTISAGATTLNFSSSQSGWTTSDRLLIPDSQQITDLSSQPPWLDEVRTPSGVTATTATVSSMTNTHKHARDHEGTVDFTPHVVNLSRNVIIRSENGDGVRGHCITLHQAKSDVRYCRFVNMGRTKNSVLPNTTTNQKGRYADHHHHIHGPGDGTQGNGGLGYDAAVDPDEFEPDNPANTRFCNGPVLRLIGNVYEDTSSDVDSHKWPITLHGTCDGLIKNNVIYNASGSGYMHEDGDELYNVIDGNLVCKVTGDGDRGDASYSDGAPGREGNGYHWPNLRNYIRNNVACNIDGRFGQNPGTPFPATGFHVYNGSAITLPNTGTGEGPEHTFPAWQGAHAGENGITDTRWPILEFRDNEVYSCVNGVVTWFIGAYYQAFDDEMPTSTFLRLNAWHNRVAVFNFPSGNLIFEDCKFRGDWDVMGGGPATTQGFSVTDYMQANYTITNCDIQGMAYGIFVPSKNGSTTDPNSNAGTPVAVSNCFLVNYWNVAIETMNAVSGGAVLTHRVATFGDCEMIRPSVADGAVVRKHLRRFWFNSPNTPAPLHWVRLDELFFENCIIDGAEATSFQSYWDEQAGSTVTPQTSGDNIGSPEAGQTNTDNLSEHGVCNAGEILPGGVITKNHFDGKVVVA